MTLFSSGKVNPLLGAACISAFPMAGRLVTQFAQDEDFENYLLLHAMGTNTAGQLGSVMVSVVLLAIVTRIMG